MASSSCGPVRAAATWPSRSRSTTGRTNPYAYNAEDFALHVTSPAGTGSPGTLVVSVSLARIGQATGSLAVILLATSGLVLLATGCLAAWVIGAMLPTSRTGRHRH